MLTLTDSFVRWVRRGAPELRLFLEITGDVDGATYRFCTGNSSVGLDFTPSMVRVTSAKREVDIVRRKISLGKVTATLRMDPKVKAMVTGNRLVGWEAVLWLGAPGLSYADLAPYAGGRIMELRPDHEAKELAITIGDGVSWLTNTDTLGFYMNDHPFQIASDVIAGANASSYIYDSDEFDPANVLYEDFSHLVVANGVGVLTSGDGQAEGTERALKRIEDVVGLTDSTFWTQEDGKFRITHFDSTAAADDDWTENDILSIKQVDMLGPLINRLTVKSHKFGGENLVVYRRDDESSITNFGNQFVAEETFETGRWVRATGMLYSSLYASAIAGDTFLVEWSDPLSGCRWPGFQVGSPPAQPADAQVSASRLLYVQIGDEIIACDQCSVLTTSQWAYIWNDPDTLQELRADLPQALQLRIYQRNVNELASLVDHDAQSYVMDVTPNVWLASRKLPRFSNGCPIVEVKTRFDKYNVQITDIVSLTTSRYLNYGKDGLTSAATWEVIGKQPEPDAEQPHIIWRLARANDSLPAVVTKDWVRLGREVLDQWSWMQAIRDRDNAENHVVSGFTNEAAVGLDMTINKGRGGGLINQMRAHKDLELTANASKDTYVYHDALKRGYVIREVANGASAPNAATTNVEILKAVSNGSAITTVTDRRALRALSGQRLVAATIDDDKITAARSLVRSNIVDGSKNVDFNAGTGWVNKSLDNLADGSTWRKVASVSASNKTQAGSYTDGSVGQGLAINAQIKNVSLLGNSSMKMFSRG